MTPSRLEECLRTLRWSKRSLADALDVQERTVRRWANGESRIPERVSEWLDRVAGVLEVNPPPRE